MSESPVAPSIGDWALNPDSSAPRSLRRLLSAPPVSVVIPTRNRPDLMAQAVASVIAQDYAGPIEIVVVFDRIDIELPVVTPPSSSRTLRGVPNDRTPGLAGARNSGILAASHQLIAFLDDDDTWVGDKLRLQVPRLLGDPGAVAAGSGMTTDDGSRRTQRLLGRGSLTHADFLRDRHGALHSSSMLYRRCALRDVGLIDEDLPGGYAEDTDVLLGITRFGRIVVVDQPLVVVRRAPGGSAFTGKWADYSTSLSHLLDKHPEFVGDRRGYGRMCSQVAFGWSSAGQRRRGVRWALRALRADPRAPRAWMAIAIAAGVVRWEWIVAAAGRRGRGI